MPEEASFRGIRASVAGHLLIVGGALCLLSGGGACVALVLGSAGALVPVLGGGVLLGGVMLLTGMRSLIWARRVGDALEAFSEGERSTGGLRVGSGGSSHGNMWNELIDWVGEMQAIDQSDRVRQALAIGVPREGDENLTAAVDALWIGMVLLDEQLVIRESNGAAASQLRLAKGELLGRELASVLNDDRLLKAARSVATGLVRRRCSAVLNLHSDDGAHSVLRCSVRPIRKTESASVLMVIEDVTQQHEADRARSELVAQAAHELRTPLTNIRLYVEELLDGFESIGPAERGESLSIINQETRRLERIVSDMLSMSEIEAGKLSISHDDVRMDDVLGILRSDYAALAREKGLNLIFDLPPKLPVLRGDRDKIALAMHNLVSNAIKYTPPGGEVRVQAESEPNRFVLKVADTGIGIAHDELSRIFDRFYRCKDERTRDVPGTGLGLSLAREVARLHGGDVTADSVPDHGSTFTLELPTAA